MSANQKLEALSALGKLSKTAEDASASPAVRALRGLESRVAERRAEEVAVNRATAVVRNLQDLSAVANDNINNFWGQAAVTAAANAGVLTGADIEYIDSLEVIIRVNGEEITVFQFEG